MPVPQFPIVDPLSEVARRLDGQIPSEKELDDIINQRQQEEVIELMKRAIKIAFCVAFSSETKLKGNSLVERVRGVSKQLHLDTKEQLEEVSTKAMVATEAIYKFIRRNQNVQHINLTSCNLNQVMLSRIALGAKNSFSLMAIHFSNNPGVTPAVKAYLQVKLRASYMKDSQTRFTTT